MNLKKIAKDAVANIDNDGNGDKELLDGNIPEGVCSDVIGDRIVLTLSIGFDPEVRNEMSKAIPKGSTRDDLVDDITGDDGKADANDEFPECRGVFAEALDEISDGGASEGSETMEYAEDASPKSRHANTPLEKCRAKDRKFCPYHGDQAIKKYLEDRTMDELEVTDLSLVGISIDVSKGKSGGGYDIKASFPKALSVLPNGKSCMDAIGSAMKKLLDTNGIIPTNGWTSAGGQGSNNSEHSMGIKVAKGRLSDSIKEWVDDLIVDLSDAKNQKALEKSDVIGLLDAMTDVDAKQKAFDENPDSQTSLSELTNANNAAIEKYKVARAMVDYGHVGTKSDVDALKDELTSKRLLSYARYEGKKDEIDKMKSVFWKNGRFPNGFAKANKFANEYNKASQNCGYWADAAFIKALEEYGRAARPYIAANSLTMTARRDVLPRLYDISHAVDGYEKAYDEYLDAADKFKGDLYDYATEVVNGSQRFPQSQVEEAFPNGRPVAANGNASGVKNPGGRIPKYTSPASISVYKDHMKLKELDNMPIKVDGSFSCMSNDLTSIVGSPKEVDGYFNCSRNRGLKNLIGAPEIVTGDFSCNECSLESLEGCTSTVASFSCTSNRLKSLNGCPKKVSGFFDCTDNYLSDLTGCPSSIVGSFICSDNPLRSLKGGPSLVGMNYDCSDTLLRDLEGAPQYVDGDFYCEDVPTLKSLNGAPSRIRRKVSFKGSGLTRKQIEAYEQFLKNPDPKHIDSTGHYVETPSGGSATTSAHGATQQSMFATLKPNMSESDIISEIPTLENALAMFSGWEVREDQIGSRNVTAIRATGEATELDAQHVADALPNEFSCIHGSDKYYQYMLIAERKDAKEIADYISSVGDKVKVLDGSAK